MTKKLTKSRIAVEPDKKPKSKSWDLLKDGIKKNKLYNLPYNTKKVEAANIIRENCEPVKKIVPGQIVFFNYFNPKTKEDLEYYDATPLTIYFNTYNTAEGPRVIGFNLHYYPPKLRYKIINAIYKLFTPMFKKGWNDGVKKPDGAFNYNYIINSLKKMNLDFGVRQYDRSLMTNAVVVPTAWLSTAIFTEGNFKKETRAQIYNYWKDWTPWKKKDNKSSIESDKQK